jgi:hypothetical protein
MSISNLVGVLDSHGKYEEAESMNRQTLTQYEKVVGAELPDTLTNMYCLAHVPANRHRYDESATLYQRAYAGYNATLGKDHPTSRAYYRHYSQMLCSRTQDPPDIRPEFVNGKLQAYD